MSLEGLCSAVVKEDFVEREGRVIEVGRSSIKVQVSGVKIGSLCEVKTEDRSIPVEIVGLREDGHIAMPLGDLQGIELGNSVRVREGSSWIPVGDQLLGRVVDSLCEPYDGGARPNLSDRMPLYGVPENPLERVLIDEPLDLGVRSINACLTCGKGQRLGIFAGSGVGKSVLLGMMSKHTEADVVVLALIGERGREVKEFIERELDPESRKKCIAIVETADKSPIRRMRGAFAATSIAEYFRNKGKNVLLLMDSLTRFAMAMREIGIAAGEPPTTKGYPASTYTAISRLAERAGNWGDEGTITGLYTVLVEGDDLDDPVADNTRAILDGHIVLSRRLAMQGHFPAVDVLASVSRVMDYVIQPKQWQAARALKRVLARYSENEDAITLGMYQRGTDPSLDECISLTPQINMFLQQGREEKASLQDSAQALEAVLSMSPPQAQAA